MRIFYAFKYFLNNFVKAARTETLQVERNVSKSQVFKTRD